MQEALVDGERVAASLMARPAWLDLQRRQKNAPKEEPVITTTFDRTIPMYCKTSKDGFQFFSLYPGQSLPPEYRFLENESPEHAITKTWIVSIARSLGYRAEFEVPIEVSESKRRIADTVIWFDESNLRNPLVVEVQLSKQDASDFSQRTTDYHEAGYDCVWLDSRIEPSQCTHPLDPVSESELEDYSDRYSIKGAYQRSVAILESTRWDGVEETDGALRFPFRCDLESFSLAVWYDHGWRDLALWVKDMLRKSASLQRRPSLTYLLLCAATQCHRCGSTRRIWLSRQMREELERSESKFCALAMSLGQSEESAITDFMAHLDAKTRGGIYRSLLISDSHGKLCCPKCRSWLYSKDLLGDFCNINRVKAAIPMPDNTDGDKTELGWTAHRPWMDNRPNFMRKDDGFKRKEASISMMEDALEDIRTAGSSRSAINLFLRRRIGWTPIGDEENQLDVWLEPIDRETARKAVEMAKRKMKAPTRISRYDRIFFWHRYGDRYKLETLSTEESDCC